MWHHFRQLQLSFAERYPVLLIFTTRIVTRLENTLNLGTGLCTLLFFVVKNTRYFPI